MTVILDNRRSAHGGACPRCGRAVLAGIDADRCALNAVVDPAALTRTGELLAAIDARATYAIDAARRLHRRGAWDLRRPSADPVLASHRCGHPLPPGWLAPPPPRPDARPAPEEPTW